MSNGSILIKSSEDLPPKTIAVSDGSLVLRCISLPTTGEEILDFVLTPGNVDDRDLLSETNLLAKIYGKLFGDKGYISQTFFEKFFIDGIHLIAKLR